jgi:HD superfamily phosphohydrolase YqeK
MDSLEDNYIKITENRLKHSLAVARQCYTLSIEKFNKSDFFAKQMFVTGYNHDIGYEYTMTDKKFKHNQIGSLMLEITFNLPNDKENKFINAIKYHGNPDTPEEYRTLEWVILNLADLTIDSKGEKVTIEQRFKDIEQRFGADSKSYYDATETYKLVLKTLKKEDYKNIAKSIEEV